MKSLVKITKTKCHHKSVMKLQPSIRSKVLTLASATLLSTLLSACGGGGGGTGASVGGSGTADTTIPVITLSGASTVNINQGSAYNDAGATANDNVDGDVSGNIAIGGDTVVTSTVGSYTISYNVSDAAGNAAVQVTRIVNVNAVASNGIAQFVAYTVKDSPNSSETIYTVRGDGSDHRELHPSIPAGGEISNHSWASSGGKIAYLGDVDTDTVTELYSVNPGTNSRVKLNGVLTSGGDVVEYKWSPDGTKVAYRANQDDFGKVELYVVDSDGQNRVKVSTTLIGGGNVEEFIWSPTTSHLLYRADATINDRFDWHIATSNGISSSQINVNIGSGITVEQVTWSPLGNYIGYTIDMVSPIPDELYAYKVSDSSNTEMLSAVSIGSITDYQWSDSDSHIVAHVGGINGSIFVTKVDGTATVDITPAPSSSSDFLQKISFLPGQTTVAIYRVVSGLYIYSSVGSLIDNEDISGGQTQIEFIFSPDKQKLLVKSSFDSDFAFYDILLATGRQLPAVRASTTPSWSEDSTRILFDPNAPGSDDSLISPDGSGLVELAVSTSSLNIADAQWVGNNIYVAGSDVAGSGTYEIIMVDKIGANPVTIVNSGSTHAFLSDTLSFDPDGPSFRLASDDSFLVYRRDSITPGEVDELHAVSADGTGDVKLNNDLTPFIGLSIVDYSIQPAI